ncbi:MAG: 5'/3'-nucleotidase SurE [Bacteroidales bacterium]|jgi:5'-nucleotidase|nr:5'/3'-nucleotidase SurE [Bacteroidales bacterium]MDI9575605.1 5'/3'-nucleotidase SurE [Bacteroidota bacterium]MDD3755882.1 5'/3'-nucleotidase SurE [Bacteroidales bacterium]MDY0400950.1 5'/3'-nucleotidase SurE [Bacteroidales bacterium]HHW59230.1 5'/3'-nucleotidase SurE [Bacteroidales bacterium]
MAKILITNDDGYRAAGLNALIEFIDPIADIVAISSETEMSGSGHAVTIKNPLRLRVHEDHYKSIYVSNGTPADNVKLAVNCIFDKFPDLILSGINHGSNASCNVFYSGTLAAVIEGAMLGIPSIGFSVDSYYKGYDFIIIKDYVTHIVKKALEFISLHKENILCLNINFPAIENPRGIKVCRMAKAKWVERFEKRIDPHGIPYYWLDGDFVFTDEGEDNDEAIVKQGYISLTPLSLDMTDYNIMDYLRSWEL